MSTATTLLLKPISKMKLKRKKEEKKKDLGFPQEVGKQEKTSKKYCEPNSISLNHCLLQTLQLDILYTFYA